MRFRTFRPPETATATPTKRRQMNKTEIAFSLILEARKRNGEIVTYGYERVTLKLADDTRYTPDFYAVDCEDGLVFYEVKGGHIRDDARVKLQVAATMYPRFVFIRAQYVKGSWTETPIPPLPDAR
jgi:hypothetical protein